MIEHVTVAYAREADLPQDDDWLSPRERAVLGGLRIEKRRRDWRLGRWAARRAVDTNDVEVVAAEDGAPEFASHPEIKLSISHSHGFGMASISRVHRYVGCDVEWIERRSREFIDSYFTPAEAMMADCPEMANAIWSAKESVLKAARVGLRVDTRTVSIQLRPDGTFDADFGGRVWYGVWHIDEGRVHTLVAG